jgi:hypothetical protein
LKDKANSEKYLKKATEIFDKITKKWLFFYRSSQILS